MKILHAMVGSAALLAASAASAQTAGPITGWYVGAAAGLNAPEVRSVIDKSGSTSNIKFKDGFAISASGGYKWTESLRTELELSYGDAALKDVNDRSTPLMGKQHDFSVMGNLLWDINTGSKLTPYVGMGVGSSWMKFAQAGVVGSPTVYDSTSSKFSWQAIAGLAYAVSPQTEITLDYRYKGSGAHRFAGSTAGASLSNYNARTNRLMLGVRFAFGAPEAPKAAPPPPPPPPPMAAAPAPRPAPPPAPKAEEKYMVFFDFDRSNLRADAQKIVAQAADTAKRTGKAHITATGHTDTSGTAAYNLGLSERRAKAVQKELNRLGIPDSEIVVRWKGESEPLVQTGDGVKEPQNRRVEIVLE